jgi:hypothetical protein
MLRSAAVLLVGVFIRLPITAQPRPQQEIDGSKLGAQADQSVPNFSLKLGGKTEASSTAMKIHTRQLEITTYPREPAIEPGDRFSVALDIEPHSNIQVYAPGAKGYRGISLSIEPNAQVRVLPLQYPAAEIYFFKVLNERVPVFQKPFRLVQELVLEGTPQVQAALREKERLTVHGTLEYQACDDRMCFFPVSVPLAWTMMLRPHAVHPRTGD